MSELVVPLETKAYMARNGLLPQQLAPYWDPERGRCDPLDDPEVRAALRSLMARLYNARLEATRG